MAISHRVQIDSSGKTKILRLTARAAILQHCKECMGFEVQEVKRCTSPLCALFPFRVRGTAKDTA